MSEPALFHDGRVTLHAGDCLDVLAALPEASVDSIVTDPPYHLTSIVKRFGAAAASPAKDYTGARENATGAYARASRGFMGQQWDGGDIAFQVELWRAALRVLKPGGHLCAFSATRTYHRMACAIEDAGFEIRDCAAFAHDARPRVAAFLESLNAEQAASFAELFAEQGDGLLAWVYGSGFPKSHDVAKAIDKTAGIWRGRRGRAKGASGSRAGANYERTPKGAAVTPDAATWDGWGTALKPAWEPIVLARKPLVGTVAENVLAHGVGALNIDACRVGMNGEKIALRGSMDAGTDIHEGWARPWMADEEKSAARMAKAAEKAESLGRWPANITHDGSAEVLAAFPDAAGAQGVVTGREASASTANTFGEFAARAPSLPRCDSGSAARFFYSAKADSDDRLGSKHPTVKPLDLMRWLVRLVTPPGGVVLDPFAGTGTTGHAALVEGFRAVLIEREAEYRVDIATRMGLVFAGKIARAAAKARPSDDAPGPLFGGLGAPTGGAGASTAISRETGTGGVAE